MSLDALFQQILLTEHQLTEQTQKFKDVKVAIIRCNEKIKNGTEKYEKASEELDEKAQQSSVMRLQHDLIKKCEDQMLKKIEELLCQKRHLWERLSKVKRESKEEEEIFLQEISRFNSDFSLRGNRETVFESQTHTEILDLEREVESLYKDMELMSSSNRHMSSMQEQKRALQLELQGLDNSRRDLDRQLSVAEAMTASLRAESLFVSQKPLTDSTCLRLRKELEMHKKAALELRQEELSSEIRLLQSMLDSSQGSEQH
ncbi:coiled-coil domain-containing protein 172 [Seriola lalandi dorsalis]|uniref:coiled-coil domain-containing protein 172 n=1 Tax=Seriola lalandi dorsalis TaxID=1841481 RepID=UPI000C6FB7E3|nr:coiled-coil domain-containing protein 172 [Seriola lalandi dorsalis]XP_056250726.1 coiled-coil domain-containing protein 172 isoform X1 [Seriola aureovittata]